MELNELLLLDSVVLVEESYAAQKWLERTRTYLGKIKHKDLESAIRIRDTAGVLIGLALRDRELGFWMIFTDVLADPGLRAEFEALAAGIPGAGERDAVVDRAAFHEAVIEYYSLGLVNRFFCACELKAPSFYPRDRVESLKVVLTEFFEVMGIDAPERTRSLEIGCGDGGATLALHEVGLSPLTIDIEKCEICKGLEEGVLDPKKSIVLDCSHLSAFFGREFELVFGFMVGKLNPFDNFMWERVLREVPKVVKTKGKVLFTVSSKEEAELLVELLHPFFDASVRENKTSNGYFDQWLYMAAVKSEFTELRV
ncbi:MAG TPA: class I SAM-dependent methyltransferase [Methanomicrobia archaeon]|nr:class I SAM-dependent methyltransferase [Methanomicrobia archaeon]